MIKSIGLLYVVLFLISTHTTQNFPLVPVFQSATLPLFLTNNILSQHFKRYILLLFFVVVVIFNNTNNIDKKLSNKLSRAIFTGSNTTLRISYEFANVKYRIVMSCYVA